MGPGGFLAKQYIQVLKPTQIAGTAGFTSRRFTVDLHRGAQIFIKRTAETGTSTVAVAVKARNPVTGDYVTLSGAVITATQFADAALGTAVLTIYPGITAADADAVMVMDTLNAFCGSYLPQDFRIEVTTTGTTNDISIGMVLLP